MSHTIKVRAVLTGPTEPFGDDTWLSPRIVQAEFLVPLDGSTQGWHHNTPFPVSISTFEFQGPDIDALVATARAQGRNELLDELTNMTISEITALVHANSPDLAITDEDW